MSITSQYLSRDGYDKQKANESNLFMINMDFKNEEAVKATKKSLVSIHRSQLRSYEEED
jgi:hypothetical protein